MSGEPGAPAAIVVTDIDGTLIDHHTYRPGPAADAAIRLQTSGIPVVLCSAKTEVEQLTIRSEIGIEGPFIVENGAAVLGIEPEVVLGIDYGSVRSRLADAARETGVTVRGYGDMTIAEISERTGLDEAGAARAAARRYSETFIIEDTSEDAADALRIGLAARGLRVLRGARFLTALGPHDKGLAVRALLESYGDDRPFLFALGDYFNDLDMLAAADRPMLVQRPGGGWADLDLPGLVRLDGVGPDGWVRGAEVVLHDAGKGRTA